MAGAAKKIEKLLEDPDLSAEQKVRLVEAFAQLERERLRFSLTRYRTEHDGNVKRVNLWKRRNKSDEGKSVKIDPSLSRHLGEDDVEEKKGQEKG